MTDASGQAQVPLKLLWALYTTQFIGVGFLTVGLTAILRADGVSLSTLGLFQLFGVIWPLKILWAPLVDRWAPMRRQGHYRGWLLLLQSGMVVSLLCMAFIPHPARQIAALGAIVALFVLLSATQDIAADAISVRGLSGRRRDTGSSIQVSAGYVGNLVGGAGAVFVADRWGLPAAGVLLAATTSLALVSVLHYREPRAEQDNRAGSTPWGRDTFDLFRNRDCRRWCFVTMPLLYMGSAGAYSLVTPALGDYGFSLTQIGLITLTVASLPAILAGLLAGHLDAKLERRSSVVLGTIMLASGIATLQPIFGATGASEVSPSSGSFIQAAIGVSLLLTGYTMVNVAVYTQALRFARPTRAGSDFTLLTCIPLGLSFLAGWVALALADGTGFWVSALAMTIVAVVGGISAWRQLGRFGSAARE
ncbi:MFS transporter [Corynebacterium heidelbergense]|uniref:MFS transporter n=1 Tax=Corynebacterium heidelbergense TaxID=2055947 RepID=A0A364VB04_9CORY|nr:MFS transporter [Corynebacterium heidelbergense]RAV33843.1 MFS transporter [Corynebacterium heidelbergense]WCZ36826.1 muropeptide transporter [Corynebacterium heidelbergense]